MRLSAATFGFFLIVPSLISTQPMPLAKTPLSPARALLMKGNYAEARAEFEKMSHDPKHGPTAVVGIATSWRQEGKRDQARAVLDDGLKRFEGNAELLAARGDLLYESGDWNAALADATEALKKNENHFPARWVKARISRDSGKLEDADAEMRWFVRAYTAASNADKDITDPDLLLIVGQAGAENARWHSLTKQFSFILNEVYGDALKYEPELWVAEYLIGCMLLEKFNRPDAVEAFDKALKLNPNAAEPYVGKGQAALQKFDLKEAEEFANEALKRNPNLGAALRLNADVHLASGNLTLAEKSLRQALAVNSKDEVAYGKLAGCLKVMKKPVDDVTAAVSAFDAKPGLYFFEMGETLENRKFYTHAEECFKKAADLRPAMAGPRTSLGMLYLRMGREEEGRKLLDAAFAADRFNVRVANMRKVMEHLDKYQTIRTAHYEVRFDGAKDRLLGEFVAEYIEEVHMGLKKQFQYEPSGLIPIQVYAKHEMFSGRVLGLPDLHTVGACTGRIVAMASPTAQGIAKPFNWGRVIRHELVHIFNLTQTDYQCPHWLTEGLAVRNEQTERPLAWTVTMRDAFDRNELFNIDNVLLGFVKPKDQHQWTLAYCQSHLYVEYIVKSYGEVAIAKLLNAFADGLDTESAIRSVCGVEKAAFESGYKKYLEEVLKPSRGEKKADSDSTVSMTLAQLEKALEDDPDDLNVKARLAEQYLKRDKPNESRKLADEVLAKKKGHPVAAIVRARLLQRAGDEDAAKETLETALNEAPDDARLLIGLGRFYIEGKDYEKAAEVLERGRKAAPLDGDWLEQLSRVYTETKQPDKLAKVLEDIVAHDPDDLAARLKLIRTLLEANDAKQALVIAKQAMQIDVTNAEVQKLFVECLSKTGGDAESMQRRFVPRD